VWNKRIATIVATHAATLYKDHLPHNDQATADAIQLYVELAKHVPMDTHVLDNLLNKVSLDQ
jgi:hypothetical protein